MKSLKEHMTIFHFKIHTTLLTPLTNEQNENKYP